MDDRLYKELCETFEAKPSRELRSIIAERDTGDWTEEAIAAATLVLAGRPDDEEIEEPEEVPEPIGQSVFALSEDEIEYYRAKIKVLGWIYCVAAVLPAGVLFSPTIFGGVNGMSLIFAFLGLAAAGVFVVIGSGLIKLDERSRGPGLMLSVLFIFLFPIGTPIGFCGIFWLGKRGSVMLSPQTNSGTEQAVDDQRAAAP